MPSLSNIISTTSATESYVQSAFSATSTLGSLLLAAVARARGKSLAGNVPRQKPSSALEGPMSRIPVTDNTESEKKIERSWRKSSRVNPQKSGSRSYGIEDESVPQRLAEDSMPMVHDRLPDPALWSKIEQDLEEQENKERDLTGFATQQQGVQGRRKQSVGRKQASSKVAKLSRSPNSDSPARLKRSLSEVPQLEGVLRRRQLYCRTGFHIQIMPNGRVTGTDKDHDRFAILEFISVDVGQVSIRGVESGRYLSMDSKGRLYGSHTVTDESVFRETLQENWYNTYSSIRHRNNSNTRACFLALGRNGRSRQGCRSNANQRFTHFLPRPVDPEKVPNLYKGILY